MENQNTKKVLSECYNTQHNLHLERGNSVNSMKKMDSLFPSGSSDVPAANVCTSTVVSESLGSTLINNRPNVVNDRDDVTTPRRKSEENTNAEIANNQVTPSRGFSDSTAVDCRITPDFFTSQNKEEFKNILKKLRRRSTIGARGSPENDSLIRYIARQRRMKVQETLSQQPSPFRNTSLKGKIAAFQSFKTLKETKEEAIHIHSISNTSLQERSALSQTWSPEDTKNAFEENLNNKFMDGDGISVDIQMHGPRFPSWKPLLSGTNAMSKAVPVSPVNTVESTSVSLVATPSMAISKSESGEDKELSRNDTTRPSSKKVRFSEKQSLEIFDESKAPIIPVGKGHSFPTSLHSALKKTPVKIVSEGSKDLQESSEKMATPIWTGSSDAEERKNNSDHQAPLIRTTRNSAKKKGVKGKNLATKVEARNQPNQLPKAKTSTKSQKNPAAQPKMVEEWGRRRKKRGKKKKEQKVLYGPRDRVSKKPLLSPILEVTENASFCPSNPNTPTLKISTSDNSLSDLHATFIDEMAEDTKSLPHAVGVDGHDQPSSPQEDDGVSSSSVQPQEPALNNREQCLPGYLPEKISPEKLKSSLNGNEQVVGRDCLSSRTAVQLEEVLNICGPGKNIEAKENSFFTVDFTTEVMTESNEVNLERNPRKSREEFLNTEGAQSNIPGGNLGGFPPCSWTADDLAVLNHFGGNRNVTKKVRRSMRSKKDAEAEGLAWVEVPVADLSQIPLESACKVPRRLSSAGPQESKPIVSSPCGPRRR